ncbi:MAG: glycoside hydrolase family 127 protein [Lachnospiraceae bacterium]|nr:glycoside hydrolase family 127 protein [Lachnospiraceae bacterium]
MNKYEYSTPLEIRDIHITDDFWKREIELVRTEVIPYQWEAINDRVEGATPSYCMRNFKVAGKLNEKMRMQGASFMAPKYTFRGFEALPEDPEHPDPDKFYGFVFQDTDFSKWIEAVGYSLSQYPDPALERIADSAIDIVCEAQAPDGYLDTYYIINGRDMSFSNLRDHHELYCLGHLIEGAVAYYQATGKDKLLGAAMRFADYVDLVFGPEPEKLKGYPGHEIAEMALVRLYGVTGDEKYLNLSRFFIDERGKKPYYYDNEYHPDVVIKGHEDEERYAYNQANRPVREQVEATGHAVRAVYLYSGMADVARLTDDEELYEACKTLWKNMVNRRMYITGGIGATHLGEAFSFDYDLPNDTAYAETCAAIGLIFFARRMLQISPDSRYADIMERALYNGALSGMALDGKSFFYVNPLEVDPKACALDERKKHVKSVRQKWFGCACCPPNIARLITSIGEYAYTESDDTFYVHQYIGGDITKYMQLSGTNPESEADDPMVNKGYPVDISIESDLPWEGNVKIRIGMNAGDDTELIEELKKFKLALRIPDWCEGEYELTGADKLSTETKNGYLYISGEWSEDNKIGISFPMKIRVMSADENVREDFGRVALSRGPVVYCLEENDNGSGLYKLALDIDKFESQSHAEVFEVCGTPCRMLYVPGITRCDYRNSDVTLDIAGSPNGRIDLSNCSSKLYSTYKPLHSEIKTLKFIPYYMWANRGENEMSVWVDVK